MIFLILIKLFSNALGSSLQRPPDLKICNALGAELHVFMLP